MGNAKTLKNHIVQWIMNYFEENGKDCYAVVGISGQQRCCSSLC